jgi:hypothetical protein
MNMTGDMRDVFIAQTNAKMAQMNSRLAYLQNPKSLEQIAIHCDGIFLILDQIKAIQTMTSPPITMDPPLDDIIRGMEKTRNIKATNFAIGAADLNIEKVKAISSERKRAKLIDEAKMLIIDAKKLVRGQEYLDKLAAKMTELGSL